MGYYCFQCRSVTYAKRASKFLKDRGVYVGIAKLPTRLSGEGCGYSIKVSERNGVRAYNLLKSAGFEIKNIYLTKAYDQYIEVTL